MFKDISEPEGLYVKNKYTDNMEQCVRKVYKTHMYFPHLNWTATLICCSATFVKNQIKVATKKYIILNYNMITEIIKLNVIRITSIQKKKKNFSFQKL